MKKSTLIFFLIFCALFTYVWFLGRKKSVMPSGPEETGKKVFSFTPDQVRAMEIDRGGKIIQLARSGPADWEITQPIRDSADRFQAENLAATLSNISAQQFVSREEGVKAYGLGTDSTSVTIELNKGKPQNIRVGSQTPTGEGCYAYLPASGKIAILQSGLTQLLQNGPDFWRDHSLLHLDPARVEQIKIASRGKTIVLKKNKGFWEISEGTPKTPVSADPEKVTSLLNTLSSFHLISFLKKAPSLKNPLVSVSVNERGENQPETLVIGSKTPQGYPTETGNRAFPYLVGEQVVTALTQNPMAYRNLHLLTFDQAVISRLEVKTVKNDYIFDKQGQDWKVTSPAKSTVQAWKAGLVLDDLKGLQAVDFPGVPRIPAQPPVIVKIWGGKTLISQVAVGMKVSGKKELAYPVEISPAGKTSWADASLLMKDLP